MEEGPPGARTWKTLKLFDQIQKRLSLRAAFVTGTLGSALVSSMKKSEYFNSRRIWKNLENSGRIDWEEPLQGKNPPIQS